MSKTHSTTTSIPVQSDSAPRRSQSSLDWNAPKKTRTPRSEYSFMRSYSMLICAAQQNGPFGPFNGGVAE